MNAVVRAAHASTVKVEGLTGEQRAWLYQVAVSTGFRASELSSLVARPLFPSMKQSCCWSDAASKRGCPTVRNSHSRWLMVFVVGLRAFHQTGDCGHHSGGTGQLECYHVNLKAAKIDVVDDKGSVSGVSQSEGHVHYQSVRLLHTQPSSYSAIVGRGLENDGIFGLADDRSDGLFGAAPGLGA